MECISQMVHGHFVCLPHTSPHISLIHQQHLTRPTAYYCTPTATPVSWDFLSGLGAASSPTKGQPHIYYTGLDGGISEFLGSNVSTTDTDWAPQPGRNHIWAMADDVGADVSALGWRDQVSMGRLVQGILSDVVWTESFVRN